MQHGVESIGCGCSLCQISRHTHAFAWEARLYSKRGVASKGRGVLLRWRRSTSHGQTGTGGRLGRAAKNEYPGADAGIRAAKHASHYLSPSCSLPGNWEQPWESGQNMYLCKPTCLSRPATYTQFSDRGKARRPPPGWRIYSGSSTFALAEMTDERRVRTPHSRAPRSIRPRPGRMATRRCGGAHPRKGRSRLHFQFRSVGTAGPHRREAPISETVLKVRFMGRQTK